MIAVFKRDFLSYFKTPIGYVFMAAFLAANGGTFALMTLQASTSSTGTYFTTMMIISAVLTPFLTMKLFSEERKTKTEQLLLTSPASIGGIVAGKFFAAYAVYLITFLIGTLNFATLYKFSAENEIQSGVLFGSSVALVLAAAAFISIGVFVSALTENQLIAAIGSIGIMAIFLVISLLNSYIPFEWLRKVLSWISIYSRFSYFNYGVFDFAALLYYASVCFVFLFLTVRVYERRRWA